jgi:hypothetical protein
MGNIFLNLWLIFAVHPAMIFIVPAILIIYAIYKDDKRTELAMITQGYTEPDDKTVDEYVEMTKRHKKQSR